MSKARRDHRGRVLRSGESQRKDLIYQYRYTDLFGKRHTVYSKDLKELREKEEEIQGLARKGVDYAAGKMTVMELVDRYVASKQGVRRTTKRGYQWITNLLRKEEFSKRHIMDVRVSDAKKFMLHLKDKGKGYETISKTKKLLSAAFKMGYEEDILVKNPFVFVLSDIIPKVTKKREAIPEEERQVWLDFLKNDRQCSKYYNENVLLLETGLRVSELCGLTRSDLDFEQRRIRVNHQLLQTSHGEYYIERPKTEAGNRYVPMSDTAYHVLKDILKNRQTPKVEIMVDGYSGFILLNRVGTPKTAYHIQRGARVSLRRYNELYPDKPLPHITPHVLRHTFCTDLYNDGLDIKSLQYVMGHSKPIMTTGTYTHVGYKRAAEQMGKVVGFSVTTPTTPIGVEKA